MAGGEWGPSPPDSEGHFSNPLTFFAENTESSRAYASAKPGTTFTEKEVPYVGNLTLTPGNETIRAATLS